MRIPGRLRPHLDKKSVKKSDKKRLSAVPLRLEARALGDRQLEATARADAPPGLLVQEMAEFVPEPSTLLLLGAGLGVLALRRRRRVD